MKYQIKFRIWDTKFGRWTRLLIDNDGCAWGLGYKTSPIESFGHEPIDNGFGHYCHKISLDRFIVQQFTGLLDKNGREIYEGDIITYRERMHEHGDIHSLKARVVYDDKYAAFGLTSINQDGELLMWNYFTDMTISDFEVVENVFEGAVKK